MGLPCLFAQADKHVSSQKLWAQPTCRPPTSLLQSHRGQSHPERAGELGLEQVELAVPWPSCLVLGAAGCRGVAWLLRDAGGCLVLQDAGCLGSEPGAAPQCWGNSINGKAAVETAQASPPAMHEAPPSSLPTELVSSLCLLWRV